MCNQLLSRLWNPQRNLLPSLRNYQIQSPHYSQPLNLQGSPHHSQPLNLQGSHLVSLRDNPLPNRRIDPIVILHLNLPINRRGPLLSNLLDCLQSYHHAYPPSYQELPLHRHHQICQRVNPLYSHYLLRLDNPQLSLHPSHLSRDSIWFVWLPALMYITCLPT